MTTSIKFNHRQFNAHVFNRKPDAVTGFVPEIMVIAALGSNALATSPTWNNLSTRVTSLNINRGRQHQLGRVEAGTAVIALLNADGELWPDNTGGAYYPNILPGKRIQIRVNWGYGWYNLFTGFIEGWSPDWIKPPDHGAVMVLTAADLIKNLSRFVIDDGSGYSQELSGTRIGNVLDAYGFPSAWRDLATGQSQMQATGAIADTKAMAHLFIVQDSEGGIMFIDGSGNVVFHDRHTRLTEYATGKATFGDDDPENKFGAVDLQYDDEYIYNYIRIEREGGSAQTAESSSSQSKYGMRGYSKSGLLMTTDSEALSQAGYFKNKYEEPRLRARSLTIYPGRDPDNLFRKVFSYEIGDRITLRKNEASLDEDYHIEGISHTFNVVSQLWKTEWQLGTISAGFWQIGVEGNSEIGETTYVGY